MLIFKTGVDAFFQSVGNTLNYCLCVIVLYWLWDFFYILWQKAYLSRRCREDLETFYERLGHDESDDALSSDLFQWHNFRLVVISYCQRDLRMREGILQGVALIFLVYVSFCIIIVSTGGQNTLNGRNVLLFSFYWFHSCVSNRDIGYENQCMPG